MLLLLEVRTARCASCLHSVRTGWLLHSLASRQIHQSSAVAAKKTHYERLGVKKNATQTEIKDAFLKISKEVDQRLVILGGELTQKRSVMQRPIQPSFGQIHPDMNPDDPTNHDKFVKLNEAYMVLSNVLAKREYDSSIARTLFEQQRRASTMHGTHSAGSSHAPGSNAAKPGYDEDDAQPFYDETLWHMRDKSKDYNAFYPEDSYYGVKGVKRMSNRVGLIGCAIIMVIGMTGFYVALSQSHPRGRSATTRNSEIFSTNKVKEVKEKVDQVNYGYLQEARARARQHGNVRQLEIMAARFEADSKAREAALDED